MQIMAVEPQLSKSEKIDENKAVQSPKKRSKFKFGFKGDYREKRKPR